jgi:TonB family protein
MSGKQKSGWLMVALIAFALSRPAAGADIERKVVSKVKPAYPALARKMNVAGAVKLEVVIAANGTIKSVKALGGHPLLIQSATEALQKWRYAPGPETTTVVEFQFHSAD